MNCCCMSKGNSFTISCMVSESGYFLSCFGNFCLNAFVQRVKLKDEGVNGIRA
jgi:hypothetical protein